MDKRKMIAEIAARHGVRLDSDDPAFLLVELNHMMFEEKEAGLKAETEAAEKRIIELIGLLQKAGDSYQEQIKIYTEAQASIIRSQMEASAKVGKLRFEQLTNEAIQASLSEVARTMRDTIHAEIVAPVAKAVQASKQNIWRNLSLCLLCGLIGGSVVVLTHNKLQEQYTVLGKAVAASWSKLDAKSKALIEGEK